MTNLQYARTLSAAHGLLIRVLFPVGKSMPRLLANQYPSGFHQLCLCRDWPCGRISKPHGLLSCAQLAVPIGSRISGNRLLLEDLNLTRRKGGIRVRGLRDSNSRLGSSGDTNPSFAIRGADGRYSSSFTQRSAPHFCRSSRRGGGCSGSNRLSWCRSSCSSFSGCV